VFVAAADTHPGTQDRFPIKNVGNDGEEGFYFKLSYRSLCHNLCSNAFVGENFQ